MCMHMDVMPMSVYMCLATDVVSYMTVSIYGKKLNEYKQMFRFFKNIKCSYISYSTLPKKTQ